MSQSCCVLRGGDRGNIYSVSKAWLLPSQFTSRFYLPYLKPNTFLLFLLLSSLKLTRAYTIHAQKGDKKHLFCQTKRAKKNKSSTQTCPPEKSHLHRSNCLPTVLNARNFLVHRLMRKEKLV